jgi:hypothetical protein
LLLLTDVCTFDAERQYFALSRTIKDEFASENVHGCKACSVSISDTAIADLPATPLRIEPPVGQTLLMSGVNFRTI